MSNTGDRKWYIIYIYSVSNFDSTSTMHFQSSDLKLCEKHMVFLRDDVNLFERGNHVLVVLFELSDYGSSFRELSSFYKKEGEE
jgi:hypothetical protein